MNNYYRSLSLSRDTHPQALSARMQDLSASQPQLVVDAAAILANPLHKEEYDKLHRQYEAMATTYELMEERMRSNTGNWSVRLANF